MRGPTDDVTVLLGPRTYTVRVVSDARGGFAAFAREALDASWAGRACRRALIVTDANVEASAAAYRAGLDSIGIACELAVLPRGEATKSFGSPRRSGTPGSSR